MAASGGHLLQQQKTQVESQIRQLRNEDLKDICRAYREAVSGTKAYLVERCVRVLNDIVRKGDVAAFEDLKRIGGIYGLPSLLQNQSNSSSNAYSSSAYQQYNMAPNRPGHSQNRLPPDGKYFKPSPFYEVLQTLLPLQDLPDGAEMPQNRHTVKSTLAIKSDVAQQFRSGEAGNLRILLYCGMSHTISPYSLTDVTFPNQIEIKVNDQDVKHNFKGLKNKAGSTKPADITAFMRKFNGQENAIQVTYALTTKRFAYALYLVRSIGADKLVERIQKGNIIPKEKVLHDMNKANADPDIAATSIRMSLKDPVSTVRIALPVRSSHCTHNQCFDGAMFLQLQEQAPQWTCPVCSKSVSFDSLCVDKYFEDILNRTSRSIEKVDIEPNGDWRIIKEEEEEGGGGKQANGTSSSKKRASYDDDFDDLVELDQPVSGKSNNKPVNGAKRDSYPLATLSPFPGPPFNFNTPPLSSREPSVAQSTTSTQQQQRSQSNSNNKRPQSAVIDLTLSDEEEDDDDDPPRPAKRLSTVQTQQQQRNVSTHGSSGGGGGGNNGSYNTPVSLAGDRFSQQQQQQQQQQQNYNHGYNQGDAYRPSSTFSSGGGGGGSGGGNTYNTLAATTATTNNFSNAQNSMSPNPVSPFGQPAIPIQHSRPSMQQQSAMFPPPPSNSPFHHPNYAIRPPPPLPPPAQQQQSSANGMNNNNNSGLGLGLRLPPMQTTNHYHQSSSSSPDHVGSSSGGGGGRGDGIFQGWRSDFDYGGHYSSSPG